MVPLPLVDSLDSITIAVSCPVSWDAMHGDRRTRFCNSCQQDVHDVSELTTAEAVQLLTRRAKSPCLRIYRRQDGRVMTADCLNRRERAWKWLRRYSAPAAALFALVFWVGCSKPLMGAVCWPEENTAALDAQLSEHTGRTAPTEPTDAEAEPTDAAARHEAETRR